MSNNVYTVREFVLENCSFERPEKFDKFHKSFLVYENLKGVLLQSPKFVIRKISESTIDLIISRNKDRHKEFYHLISHMEDMSVQTMIANIENWFSKKCQSDLIEQMFRSSIHKGLEIDDPYIFRCPVSNHLHDEFHANQTVICLFKINGIVIGNNSFKLDMQVVQMKEVDDEKIVESAGPEKNYTHVENQIFEENASVIPGSLRPRVVEEKVINMENYHEPEKVINVEKIPEKTYEDSQTHNGSVIDHDQMSLISDMLKALASNDSSKIKELASLLK